VRQFDLVENLNARTRGRYPLAVVLQHDSVDVGATIIVAPLTPISSLPQLDRLHPAVAVEQQHYRIIVEELAAVHRRTVGRIVSNIESERYAIVAALDMLFTGI
jgi:hypothetical protein